MHFDVWGNIELAATPLPGAIVPIGFERVLGPMTSALDEPGSLTLLPVDAAKASAILRSTANLPVDEQAAEILDSFNQDDSVSAKDNQ